jgi:phenylacetate-CoA ligase
MEKITGRSDDMIILRGVNVFPTQIEEQLMRVSGLSPHFQLELNRAQRMDTLTVHTEIAEASVAGATRDSCAGELAKHIKDVIGISVNVEVGDVGAVPRSQGKAVRLVDNRPADK